MQEEISRIVKKKGDSVSAYWAGEKACPKENTKSVAKQPLMHHITRHNCRSLDRHGITAPETQHLQPKESREQGRVEEGCHASWNLRLWVELTLVLQIS